MVLAAAAKNETDMEHDGAKRRAAHARIQDAQHVLHATRQDLPREFLLRPGAHRCGSRRSSRDRRAPVDAGDARQQIVDLLLCLSRERESRLALRVRGQDPSPLQDVLAHRETERPLLLLVRPNASSSAAGADWLSSWVRQRPWERSEAAWPQAQHDTKIGRPA